MTAQEFAYWLQGYFELTPESNGLSAAQAKVIKDHLKLVFQKVTPPMFTPCVGDTGSPFGPECGGKIAFPAGIQLCYSDNPPASC